MDSLLLTRQPYWIINYLQGSIVFIITYKAAILDSKLLTRKHCIIITDKAAILDSILLTRKKIGFIITYKVAILNSLLLTRQPYWILNYLQGSIVFIITYKEVLYLLVLIKQPY